MADHEHSPAYLALTPAGRRVLHVIESEVERGMASISLNDFTQRFGCSRAGARYGLKQCALLGFVSIDMGPRRVNVFALADGWKSIDRVEASRLVQLAKLPKPPRASTPEPAPTPKPVKQPKPVEPPRMRERRMPSMPVFSWDRDGR